MENMGLISIIVPVYNAEKFLRQCINSVLQQTYQEYELILVDDGSSDDSWKIINEYIDDSYGKVKGVRKENGGPNSARKMGLEIASGEFVMFIDADDYVDKTICQKLVQALNIQKVDMTLSGVVKVLNNININVPRKWKSQKYKGDYIAENIIDQNTFYVNHMSMALWGNLYKINILKNIFKEIDLKINFSEDYACFLLALLDSKHIFFLDESLYYYRHNEFSLTHKHSKSNFESQKSLYRFLVQQLKKRDASIVIYKQLEWMIIRNLLLGGYESFKEKDYLYPFKKVKRGSNIIIYGAGVFGGELFAFVKRYRMCNVVLWVDQHWKQYQIKGISISPIDEINNIDYDYIVIAILKINVALEVKGKLKERGINEKKIEVMDQKLISYQALPESFWNEESI